MTPRGFGSRRSICSRVTTGRRSSTPGECGYRDEREIRATATAFFGGGARCGTGQSIHTTMWAGLRKLYGCPIIASRNGQLESSSRHHPDERSTLQGSA